MDQYFWINNSYKSEIKGWASTMIIYSTVKCWVQSVPCRINQNKRLVSHPIVLRVDRMHRIPSSPEAPDNSSLPHVQIPIYHSLYSHPANRRSDPSFYTHVSPWIGSYHPESLLQESKCHPHTWDFDGYSRSNDPVTTQPFLHSLKG